MSRYALVFLALGLMVGIVADASGEGRGPTAKIVWAKAFGGAGKDEGRALATNAQGLVAVTGRARDEASFGGATLKSASRGTGAFLALYGADGSHRWSKLFGGARTAGFGVALAADGGVALTGMNGGQLSFEGHAIAGPTNLDVFVACFGADGGHRWSRGFGGGGDDVGCAVSFDAKGNVVVAGTYNGDVSAGGARFPDSGGIDAFVAKYAAADGKHLWSRAFSGTGNNGVVRGGHYLSLAVAADGGIVVAGGFEGTMAVGATTLLSKGESDGFVARLAPDGTPTWAVACGGPLEDVVQAITVDGEANVYACGGFRKTADFGGTSLTSGADQDAFVWKLTPGGKTVWAKRFGGGKPKTGPLANLRFPTQAEFADGIALAPGGHIVLTGLLGEPVDLGTGVLAPDGRQDAFLLVLGADGAALRSARLGGPGRDFPRDMAPLQGGDVVLTGSMEEAWAGGVKSAGKADVFVARVTP